MKLVWCKFFVVVLSTLMIYGYGYDSDVTNHWCHHHYLYRRTEKKKKNITTTTTLIKWERVCDTRIVVVFIADILHRRFGFACARNAIHMNYTRCGYFYNQAEWNGVFHGNIPYEGKGTATAATVRRRVPSENSVTVCLRRRINSPKTISIAGHILNIIFLHFSLRLCVCVCVPRVIFFLGPFTIFYPPYNEIKVILHTKVKAAHSGYNIPNMWFSMQKGRSEFAVQ